MTSKNAQSQKLIYFNRQKGYNEEEEIYGGELLKWLYGTNTGRIVSRLKFKTLLSKLYGIYQNSSLTQKQIKPFIKNFNIAIDDFEMGVNGTSEKPYRHFNEFFIRKFKPNKRIFSTKANELCAFAEGRYLSFNKIYPQQKFPVKGQFLTASALINHSKWNKTFLDGPMIISRLNPTDYHRFHFPDAGKVIDFFKIKGHLHSVNPFALQNKDDIFCTNERHVSIIETANFGKICYIEVGALCVGKIVQTHHQDQPFKRGEEKGYFLFGGSTVILLGEKNKWSPDQDILDNSQKKLETYLQLGNHIARN